MVKQQYIIDCLQKDIPLEYLEECNTVDTRLTKINTIVAKEFDINILQYQPFVSHFHTIEGSKGVGMCIASKYIHGKCLPMNNWIGGMTKYSICILI